MRKFHFCANNIITLIYPIEQEDYFTFWVFRSKWSVTVNYSEAFCTTQRSTVRSSPM